MYEVVSGLLEVFSAMFQGYCLQYFFGSFLESRIRRRHAGLWTVFLYAVLKLGMDLILPSDHGSVRIFIKLALTLCILTVLVVCCYRAAGKIKVFLVAAFLAAGEFSFFLAYNVCWLGNNLYSVWMWCLEKGYIASVDIFNGLLEATIMFRYLFYRQIFCYFGMQGTKGIRNGTKGINEAQKYQNHP